MVKKRKKKKRKVEMSVWFYAIPLCSSHDQPTDGTLCHTWALTHTTDLDPGSGSTSGSSGFSSVPESYFIPSPCDSVLRQCALQGCTRSFQKCSGHSLSLTALRAFSGTIVMDSESSWFIDHSPQLSCEYSNSYQSPPEVTFPQSLSLSAL